MPNRYLERPESLPSAQRPLKAFAQADATRIPLADDSVSLVMGSPPYLKARSYGINAQRGVDDWIEFMLRCTAEAVRVSRGLVLWVCAGQTTDHCYQPGPEGLLYRWWQQGGREWRPAYWFRHGICGGGGKQGLCPKVEYVFFFTKCETYIPWADNTANGHPPKWAPGGEMSYRLTGGERRNAFGMNHAVESRGANESDPGALRKTSRPSHAPGLGEENARQVRKPKVRLGRGMANGIHGSTKGSCVGRRVPSGKKNGDVVEKDAYLPPVLANPGNLIHGIKVGGGMMGHKLAHENEAPYPQKLAEWFIRSYCEPGGIVLDPFSGSGTTVAAAVALGRHGIGLDLRFNQCELGRRRCEEVQPVLFEEAPSSSS